MAKKKFKANPFKKRLDHFCAIVVKTRDDFTCQVLRPGCKGSMLPGDSDCHCHHIEPRTENKTRWDLFNTLTVCKYCHAWAHAHPRPFNKWFIAKYPSRDSILDAMLLRPNKTWRQADFEVVERQLIEKAIDLEVDYLNIHPKYRARFKKIKHLFEV